MDYADLYPNPETPNQGTLEQTISGPRPSNQDASGIGNAIEAIEGISADNRIEPGK